MSDCLFTFIQSAIHFIYKTFSFYTCHNMLCFRIIFRISFGIIFSDIQADRLNRFSTVCRIRGRKNSKFELEDVSFLNLRFTQFNVVCSFYFFRLLFFGRILISLILLTDQFLFQNLIETCMFPKFYFTFIILMHFDLFIYLKIFTPNFYSIFD